ncbi:hypothetical protein GCM10010365_61920 [Streptomyces poonensis]|uniref:Uncharacterized protein n=1 Tax=Streptomyces poonensis TaxID=68255 RepID=A0A918USV3_9ACTN|nr:hypothetical protein GCM10010365_61920 [Streptomyces poonensis]GLJ92861.1 hypothetical protein GCM10017589_54710 [Streptomyces poonensis]
MSGSHGTPSTTESADAPPSAPPPGAEQAASEPITAAAAAACRIRRTVMDLTPNTQPLLLLPLLSRLSPLLRQNRYCILVAAGAVGVGQHMERGRCGPLVAGPQRPPVSPEVVPQELICWVTRLEKVVSRV